MTESFHGPLRGPQGTTFRVWAPRHEQLSVRLDGTDYPMERDERGRFVSAALPAAADSRYAFVFADGRVRPDPASRRQPEGVHAASQLFDPRAFRWRTADWKGMPLEEAIFYELHVGTFTPEGTLDAAAARLPSLAELGVTCVELMPVQPFAGSRNWGYDGVELHAVHEAYGGPGALQRFVDAAHGCGLAVCLDVVYNHLGPEGNYLGEFGPYFTSRHKSPWGDGLNYDGADAGPVRKFMMEAALGWVRDFRVDALRLDAVHAIVDESEKYLLAEMAEEILAYARGAGREVHLIAESDLNDRRVVEPLPGGWGFGAAWADDFHHALHALLTGERAHFYADFGGVAPLVKALEEGFVYQGQASGFRGRPHGTSTRGLQPSHFVFCAQNHDQVGNRPLGERLSTLVPFEALEAVAALTLLGPGLPLLFMGEEYGECRPFLYFTSHNDPGLAKAVSEGRKGEFIALGATVVPDPQAQSTFEASKLTHQSSGKHGRLREAYRTLLALRKKHRDVIARSWPRVRAEGRRLTLERPGLALDVNLSPEPAGGLNPWGWRVREERQGTPSP